jgi:hypothetical protein
MFIASSNHTRPTGRARGCLTGIVDEQAAAAARVVVRRKPSWSPSPTS